MFKHSFLQIKYIFYRSNYQSHIIGDSKLEAYPKFGKNGLKLSLKAKG